MPYLGWANLRDHPNVRVPVKVKDDFPRPQGPQGRSSPCATLPRAPATATTCKLAVVLFLADRRRPAGGGGHSVTCILELAVGAGALRLPPLIPPCSRAWTTAIWRIPGTGSACVRPCGYALACSHTRRIRTSSRAPGAFDQALASDAALDDWLLHRVTTMHISGTCKMGPAPDPLAWWISTAGCMARRAASPTPRSCRM